MRAFPRVCVLARVRACPRRAGMWSTTHLPPPPTPLRRLLCAQSARRIAEARTEAAEGDVARLRMTAVETETALADVRARLASAESTASGLTSRAQADADALRASLGQRLKRAEERKAAYRETLATVTKKAEGYKRTVLQLHALYKAAKGEVRPPRWWWSVKTLTVQTHTRLLTQAEAATARRGLSSASAAGAVSALSDAARAGV